MDSLCVYTFFLKYENFFVIANILDPDQGR